MQILDVLHLTFGVTIAPWELVRFRQHLIDGWVDAKTLPGIRNAHLGHYLESSAP